MEWVETVAKTLAEAREMALDRLGVGEDDAEFEVLEEPKAGLFGRVRGEARVRARVRPTAVRPKQDRRSRGRQRTDRPEKEPAPLEGVATRESVVGGRLRSHSGAGNGKREQAQGSPRVEP